MSIAAAAVKRVLQQQAPKITQRGFQTSRSARSGYHEDYIHAEHMYDIESMKHRKLKFALGVSAVVGGGTAIPWVAVWWTQKKRAG